MTLLDIMRARHSIRKYTGEAIPEESLHQILEAGLLSASSRARRPWELIVVRDRQMLSRISECRIGSARMLAGADAAIVVLGDETKSDVWIEDCAIVMSNMHLMAASLGVGSCWIQGRLREAPDHSTTEEYLRNCLGYADNLRLEAILSLGMPAEKKEPADLDKLSWEKVRLQ